MFLFLPSTGKDQNTSDKSLSERIADVKTLIFEEGSAMIHLYYTFTGVTVACYAGFLYQLIDRAYPQQQGQTDDTYKKDLKFH